MINNVFDMIRLLIDFSFFINQDDNENENDEFSDEEEDDFNVESAELDLDSARKLKQFKDYKSNNSLNGTVETDSIWKTFQIMSGNLIKLPASMFAEMMLAHPLILIHYSTQIMDLLHDCLDKIKTSCPKVEGFTLIQPLEYAIDTVKTCLVKKICRGWVEGTFIHILPYSITLLCFQLCSLKRNSQL